MKLLALTSAFGGIELVGALILVGGAFGVITTAYALPPPQIEFCRLISGYGRMTITKANLKHVQRTSRWEDRQLQKTARKPVSHIRAPLRTGKWRTTGLRLSI